MPRNWLLATLYRWLRGPILNVDAAIAIGSRALAQYLEVFPNKPCLNQPYAIDVESCVNRDKHKDLGVVKILFCGQLIKRKGFDLLLKAFQALINDPDLEQNLELIVVGDGEYKGLIDGVEGVAKEHIQYLGFVQPSELPNVFLQADLFVLPSRYDGWGVVINQAIAAQLPIVTTEAVGAAEYVDDRNGRVIRPNDTASIVSAIKDLILNRKDWPLMWKHNRDLSEEISPESGARNIVGFLEECT